MTIIAHAPVPAASRIDLDDTLPGIAALPTCPLRTPWCTSHSIFDDGAQFCADDYTLVKSPTGRENREVVVQASRLHVPLSAANGVGWDQPHDEATVRLESSGDVDLTPGQALELARVLIERAHQVLTP